MIEDQLIDFVRGKITESSEIKSIMDWIESTPENRKTYNDILNSWALSGIRQDNSGINVDRQFREFKRRNFRITLITEYLKYAAAVLILLSIGALAQYFISDKAFKQDIVWH